MKSLCIIVECVTLHPVFCGFTARWKYLPAGPQPLVCSYHFQNPYRQLNKVQIVMISVRAKRMTAKQKIYWLSQGSSENFEIMQYLRRPSNMLLISVL
ncbi:hypothetical protein BT63DRAFT_199965 [Microthyrium microscopicum]|uniref:Uncharacterized protein n=1 Tax=Microthyrium microscopicum TaxID=703497 RepID=A0A6A6UEM4_9PEZI|nr:hypothetical protein BT63DRAFT_199965 [Microthyrium microscopicum]